MNINVNDDNDIGLLIFFLNLSSVGVRDGPGGGVGGAVGPKTPTF